MTATPGAAPAAAVPAAAGAPGMYTEHIGFDYIPASSAGGPDANSVTVMVQPLCLRWPLAQHQTYYMRNEWNICCWMHLGPACGL